MAGTRDEQQLIAQGFRRVYAALDLYDGRRGAAALECEQWAIFATWNQRYEPVRPTPKAIRASVASTPATTS
ncbi:hypothetical protein ACFCYM_27995 [Streptomyces sp. NPDC056254]|uniref:hypothetical protein n=1 Tax=Streptomyces sp. NPDC056254 TaxID=3345763 RepID=UPI0035DD8B8F